jgi:hypothetical protein
MSGTEAELAKKYAAMIWSAEQNRDFEAILKRSTVLGKKLKREDFDPDGNAVGEWAKVLADLDAWAAKHGVKFKTTEHQSGSASPIGATPRTHAACPGTTSYTETERLGHHRITTVTTCHLRRQTWLGRCVVDCVEAVTVD